MLSPGSNPEELVKVSRFALTDDKFKGRGIFTRCLEMMGAYITSCTKDVFDKEAKEWREPEPHLKLEINTTIIDVWPKLDEMQHYEYQRMGSTGNSWGGTHGKSKVWKYTGPADPPCSTAACWRLWA